MKIQSWYGNYTFSLAFCNAHSFFFLTKASPAYIYLSFDSAHLFEIKFTSIAMLEESWAAVFLYDIITINLNSKPKGNLNFYITSLVIVNIPKNKSSIFIIIRRN